MDEFASRLNQPLLRQITALLPAEEPVFLVGGAVRDALLNRPNYDLDFTTAGDALTIARKVANALGAAYYPLDTERKVARLIMKPVGEENTALGKVIRIDFSKFQGQDLLHDLQGRDFTINAMALELHGMEKLVDPLGGAADLLARRLRACSATSFLDDPVRILRAVRFSVDLQLSILPETLQLMRQSSQRIPTVSAERLRDELFRILIQPHCSTSLRILDTVGAVEQVLPEVSQLKGVEQFAPHTLDAWNHTLDLLTRLETLLDILAGDFIPDKAASLIIGLAALRLGRFRPYLSDHLRNAMNPDRPHRGLLFLAGLYHDVGKQDTQSVEESGRIRFLEHEQVGARLAEQRGVKLRLSNQEIERLISIVRHHMRPSLLSHPETEPSKKAIYRFFRDTGAAGVDICILSLADMLATYGPTLQQERWSRHLDVVCALLSAWWEHPQESILPPAVINGDLIMRELSLVPGPVIGYLLEAIREAQVSGEVMTSLDALNLARSLLQEK